MPKKKELTFEESLERLETLVRDMEGGKLTLQELVSHYGEGVELSNRCLRELEAAENTMDRILQESGGKLIEKPLDLECE